jgi:hypothetical protein
VFRENGLAGEIRRLKFVKLPTAGLINADQLAIGTSLFVALQLEISGRIFGHVPADTSKVDAPTFMVNVISGHK